MGKKRKVGESSEQEGLEQIRSEEEDKPHKKKQKKRRDQQLDFSQEGKQPKDHENQREREKKRKKEEKSSNDGGKFYSLPGQIQETPNERDPFRVFLELLYQQLPDNELARQWMIEWGLLPHEEAIKLLETVVNEKDVSPDGAGKAKAKLKKKNACLLVG